MNKTKENKGITLIALIITVVIVLILAVITINAINGDGIFQHANNAATKYSKASSEEKDLISKYLSYISDKKYYVYRYSYEDKTTGEIIVDNNNFEIIEMDFSNDTFKIYGVENGELLTDESDEIFCIEGRIISKTNTTQDFILYDGEENAIGTVPEGTEVFEVGIDIDDETSLAYIEGKYLYILEAEADLSEPSSVKLDIVFEEDPSVASYIRKSVYNDIVVNTFTIGELASKSTGVVDDFMTIPVSDFNSLIGANIADLDYYYVYMPSSDEGEPQYMIVTNMASCNFKAIDLPLEILILGLSGSDVPESSLAAAIALDTANLDDLENASENELCTIAIAAVSLESDSYIAFGVEGADTDKIMYTSVNDMPENIKNIEITLLNTRKLNKLIRKYSD